MSGFGELGSWVLGFGGLATIESPDEARAELRAAVERIVASLTPQSGS